MNDEAHSTWKARFESELPLIRSLLHSLARKRRLGPDELEDFESYVMLKLIEDDYRRLRKFQGKSSLRTYLMVVIQRLLLDFRTEKWGKWKPSRTATSLGEVAVRLETLVYRDGLGFQEAAAMLAADRATSTTSDALRDLFLELPVRTRPRAVDEKKADLFCHYLDDDAIEREERRALVQRVESRLREAIERLDEGDRRLVHLRFRDRLRVPRIARIVGQDPRRLYARLQKILKQLRSELEARGLERRAILEILDRRELTMELVSVGGQDQPIEKSFVRALP